jgi:hypothetical protein
MAYLCLWKQPESSASSGETVLGQISPCHGAVLTSLNPKGLSCQLWGRAPQMPDVTIRTRTCARLESFYHSSFWVTFLGTKSSNERHRLSSPLSCPHSKENAWAPRRGRMRIEGGIFSKLFKAWNLDGFHLCQVTHYQPMKLHWKPKGWNRALCRWWHSVT